MVDETLLQKIAAYQPSDACIALLGETSITMIVGVSGAGKDTIIAKLIEKGGYYRTISSTTRPMRENRGVMEQDGVEYHFIDMPTAGKMLDEQAFIEAKMYSNNIYGSGVADFQRAHDEGKIAISDVEVKGVSEYVELTPTVRPIFVLPPSFEVWQQRFLSRYGDTGASHAADIKRRLAIARDELRFAQHAEYYSLVINDDLEKTVAEVDRLAHMPVNQPVRGQEALTLIDDLLAQLDAKLG